MSTLPFEKLTSNRMLALNSLISLFTQGFPIIIAFFTLPLIINGLGIERFGILTLIWAIIGASSILDFGLGHALTQFISRKLGLNDVKDLQTYVWTAIFVIFILGIIAATGLCFLVPVITKGLIRVPENYIEETNFALYVLALSLPLLMLNISLVGVLESFQKFREIGVLKIPIIFCNYVGPLLVLPFTQNLAVVVSVLVLGRFLSSVAYFVFCYRLVSEFSGKIRLKLSYIKPLLRFGSWITVSNLLNTIIMNLDRFFIAALVSTTIVAYYTTPLEILLRISIIPSAIMSVMFPAFSAEFVKNKARSKKLFFQSLQSIFIIIFPITLIIAIFSEAGLALWINSEFAEKSYRVAQIMAVGTLLQSLNIICNNFIQATGRSDIAAKVLMVELPVYIALLLILTAEFGIIGAAFAWLLRAIMDFIILGFFALRLANK